MAYLQPNWTIGANTPFSRVYPSTKSQPVPGPAFIWTSGMPNRPHPHRNPPASAGLSWQNDTRMTTLSGLQIEEKTDFSSCLSTLSQAFVPVFIHPVKPFCGKWFFIRLQRKNFLPHGKLYIYGISLHNRLTIWIFIQNRRLRESWKRFYIAEIKCKK